MSYLLMVAVAIHTAFTPAANWAIAAACQSEEETEPRENPAEEEVAEFSGPAPPRAAGFNRFRATFLTILDAAAKSTGALTTPRSTRFLAELAGRNGLGAPLRC